MTSRMSIRTSGSHRNSGRVAMITFSFGSRMRSPGAVATAAMLGGRAPRGSHRFRRSGRRADQALEQVEWPAARDARHAAQDVQRAVAVLGDLTIDRGANVELVQDRPDLLDVVPR